MKGMRKLTGGRQLQAAMPMGGIGAGTICFNGHGGLQDFSIRNRPDTTALPDIHGTKDAAFALLHIKGAKGGTRLCEGPLPVEKIYSQGLKAQGIREGGYEGLPRFRKCLFEGAYPFGTVKLSDPAMPVSVTVTAFNPFIPLDDGNSSLPCILLDYTLQNISKSAQFFEFSYHLSHLAQSARGGEFSSIRALPGKGVFMYNDDPDTGEHKGSAALVSLGEPPKIKGVWMRGHWFDGISALWRECSTGMFQENSGSEGKSQNGRQGSSILFSGSLKPGESKSFPLAIAWHFPNVYKAVPNFANERAAHDRPQWHPYYTALHNDALSVADYLRQNYSELLRRTRAFQQALFSSTLPESVLDAVSANLGILKSPTVLRQKNGNIWAWEGCFPTEGSCHGSCTHVWNYAQAMPHLFPALERTLREQELYRSMYDDGGVCFRATLPDGPPDPKRFHAAADGQLGGIMKVYREWQICGDDLWMRRIYPNAKRSLDYCIKLWDPDNEGVVREPHHNTYDFEFWGPEGMCTTVYIGALCALGQMARHLENTTDAEYYSGLAEKGAVYLDKRLFNGDYYYQKIMWKELKDQSFAEWLKTVDENSLESDRVQKKEGPKYQYGTGCLSDAVIGAWMAKMYGIETPMSSKNIVKTLGSIHKNNFKRDLFDHVNCQRPGFALGHEAGLVLCSWPKGNKPTLPFVYSDEVFTGVEYQVASHLISEGLVKEGLDIVKGARDRYDGRTRNPWNEYECGSYYARAMASYALLQAFSGFRYSAVQKKLFLAPQLKKRPFQIFISTATGWGTLRLESKRLSVKLWEGTLEIKAVSVVQNNKTRDLEVNRTAQAGKVLDIRL